MSGMQNHDSDTLQTVPLGALRNAETQALHWKKQAEQLSSLINRATAAGALATNYVTEARMIQAGWG